jgi:hypothetical protein
VYLHLVTSDDGPMSDLYVEFTADATDTDGIATREVGLDRAGRVVHRMPSDRHRFGLHGLFDPAVVTLPMLGESGDCSPEEFEAVWNRPDLDPAPPTYRWEQDFLARIRQGLRKPPPPTLDRVPLRPGALGRVSENPKTRVVLGRGVMTARTILIGTDEGDHLRLEIHAWTYESPDNEFDASWISGSIDLVVMPFRGSTQLDLHIEDVVQFRDELRVLYEEFRGGVANLRSTYGTPLSFTIHVAPTGSLHCTGDLTANLGAENEQRLEFNIDPQSSLTELLTMANAIVKQFVPRSVSSRRS